MYEVLEEGYDANRIIGAFATDRSADFKSNIQNMMESFMQANQISALNGIGQILTNDVYRADYKERLLGDTLQEGAFGADKYQMMHKEKLEQLFENSAEVMVTENSTQQLAPIVGLTLPVLKKNYLDSHAKDVIMTEIPTKPIVKVTFERKFLKDKEGNKFYIPDIYWDDSYKAAIAKARGKKVSDVLYPTAGSLPFQDLNILNLSGGTIEARDSLALDFHIQAVVITVKDAAGTGTEDVTIEGLNIQPDFAANGVLQADIKAENKNDQSPVKDTLLAKLDSYHGTISVSSTSGLIKKVKFGGHLSNENNYETLELDRERENREWKVSDGVKLNTGLTVEKIKDWKALADINVTTEVIADMSEVLSQTEDSEIFDFLDSSLAIWKNRKENLPFGYKEMFVESYVFPAVPPSNVHITTSQWISTELKFMLDREIDQLKMKLKTSEVMFVVFGNPNNVTLIQENVKWVIDRDTKVGGVQLDYRFGVMSSNQNRVHVVSSMKVDQSKGLRIVAFPLTKNVYTFKHLKYSLNIENMYRNPNTPTIPNIMATSRYKTTELLPVQGEFKITENDFGRQDLNP